MLDLLCNVLAQARIRVKASHFPVSFGFLEGIKRTSAIAVVDFNEGHCVVRACTCFVRNTVALEHELPGVKHLRGSILICSGEEIEHD